MTYKIKATINDEGKIVVKESGLIRFIMADEFREYFVSVAEQIVTRWGHGAYVVLEPEAPKYERFKIDLIPKKD